MNSKAQYWIETAQYDIDSAKVMLEGRRFLYVGFLCHLTAEKALKAAIANIADEEIPPKIHNLLKLASMTSLYSRMNEEQQQLLAKLNPLNIEARYPSYKDGLSAGLEEGNCRELIRETEELLCWTRQQL